MLRWSADTIRGMDDAELMPQPRDPRLAEVAAELESGGYQAEVYDAQMRLVYVTPDMARSYGLTDDPERLGYGLHGFDRRFQALREALPRPVDPEAILAWHRRLAPTVLRALPGGIEAVRAVASPETLAVYEEPPDGPVPGYVIAGRGGQNIPELRRTLDIAAVWVVLRDPDGTIAGYAAIAKPALGGAVLGMLAMGDDANFARLARIAASPGKRPAAVMFADLEGSSRLARELPTAAYARLIRRLARAIDGDVVARGGIVGKHAGDGATAFFLAEDHGGASVAASAAIASARAALAAASAKAAAAGLDPGRVRLNVGLHWAAGPYVSVLFTSGRLEATAYGDEVNDAARIEQTAAGGQILASKVLLEQLDGPGAAAAGVDPGATAYTPLGDLPGATDKARRDAAHLPVTAL